MNQIVEEITLVPVTIQTENNEEVLTTNIKVHRKSNYYYFSSKKYLKQFILWILMFICLLLIAGPLAYYISYAVPTVKTRNISRDIFSEQRALDYLYNLTQYGSRVRNTRGNFQARDYLLSQIHRISSTNKRHLRFQIELQNFTDLKQNLLQNILVRVSNTTRTLKNKPSLMLSAHYDSVEFSSGACDDGSGVVILLELFSNLVHDITLSFSNMDLIVLFTNAEESGLEGAKAFITEHRWQSDIHYFINVDSMSCNEVASLMKITQSQLVIDYSRVKRPRANVINEYISKLPLWGSDYSILHLNNTRLGYDIGFFLDGYTYHTPLDHPTRVKEGIIQDLGENLGILIRNLFRKVVSVPENITDTDPLIYFDILSLYLVLYKQSTSILIQHILIILTVIVGIILVGFDHIWHRKNRLQSCNDHRCVYFYFQNSFTIRIISIIIYFISNIISIICGFLISIMFSWLMSNIRSLAWNGNATLAMFLYSLPYLISFLIVGYLCNRYHYSILRKSPINVSEVNENCLKNVHFNFEQNFSILLFYCLLMMTSILSNQRTFYLVLIWSIFICPIYLCVMIIEFISHWKQIHWTLLKEKSYWLYLPLIISLLPLTHTIGISSYSLRLLIPLAVKFFSFRHLFDVNIVISGIVFIPTLFIALNLSSIVQRIRYFIWILIVVLITFLIVFIIAIARQPFDKNHPHAFYVNHTSTSIYRVEELKNVPMIIPFASQSASITVLNYDGRPLSPLLDQFFTENNYKLQNKRCRYPIDCTFDDTFNRKMSIKQIRIESIDKSLMKYTVVIQHVLSYNIYISSTSDTQLTIWNQFNLPRTETIIDVTLDSPWIPLIQLDINIQRCDISDSPFLLSFTRFMSDSVLMGEGNCSSIDDNAILTINRT
ncbi:unnamed protein product [Adineta steineri]|uniref:Peptidase M28 domain-containing protein n=1 Tax=Adineta steineri TaxID=433720 RepID=A0A816EMH4_9BILA|nr:unnamed protein product [Adineta steineri]CAF1651514.1 unnamed protein product [Adineta steineri]